MLKSIVGSCSPQMTARRLRFATFRICNTYCFPRNQWLHEHINVTLNLHCLSFLLLLIRVYSNFNFIFLIFFYLFNFILILKFFFIIKIYLTFISLKCVFFITPHTCLGLYPLLFCKCNCGPFHNPTSHTFSSSTSSSFAIFSL